jgi:protein-tyrosine phosphatase
MIKVIFVCLGNICRSPMAEAVFRHKVKEAGLSDRVLIDSAGTGDWHAGEHPHEGTQRILKQHKIDYNGIRARQLKVSDFDSFDVMVAMDGSNVSNMKQIAGTRKDLHIHMLLDYWPERGIRDVPDPYYTGNFEEVYEMVEQGSDRLLVWIRERYDLL